VQIAGVPIRTNVIDAQRNHAWRVRPIDKAEHAPAFTPTRNLGHRQDQRRRTCDVINNHQPGSIIHR